MFYVGRMRRIERTNLRKDESGVDGKARTQCLFVLFISGGLLRLAWTWDLAILLPSQY